MAREVVDKCDLIHKSQLADVEQIIFYLKNRKDNAGGGVGEYLMNFLFSNNNNNNIYVEIQMIYGVSCEISLLGGASEIVVHDFVKKHDSGLED